jgi:hypothetical protein
MSRVCDDLKSIAKVFPISDERNARLWRGKFSRDRMQQVRERDAGSTDSTVGIVFTRQILFSLGALLLAHDECSITHPRPAREIQ